MMAPFFLISLKGLDWEVCCTTDRKGPGPGAGEGRAECWGKMPVGASTGAPGEVGAGQTVRLKGHMGLDTPLDFQALSQC